MAAIATWAWHSSNSAKTKTSAQRAPPPPRRLTRERVARSKDSVDLSDTQLASVKVEPVEEREFPVEKDAVGSIDFNEDLSVQVFTPYQGRIIALFAEVGDRR